VPALTRAGCLINFPDEEIQTNRPAFWPAAVKDVPLNVEMPTHSDHPGLPSLRDEANRCWDMAFQQMQDRGEWLRLMGAARCMADTLLLPFLEVGLTIRYEGPSNKLQAMLDELAESKFPETRLLAYKLADKTPYDPKTPAPGWVQNLV
jgi:hypothetical protein